jgi:hypothetical protein
MTPPATASTANSTLIEGRRNRFLFSQWSCADLSGSGVEYGVSDSGPGSEVDDGEGELGRVTYRGVGTELGT